MSVLVLFLVSCVALVSAGEEAMAPSEMDPHHHMTMTTVCIQILVSDPPVDQIFIWQAGRVLYPIRNYVHGSPSALCGPQVPMKPESARGANLQMQMPVESSRANQAAQFRDAMTGGPPSDAVLQGYYDNVPVYKMRSGDEIQQAKASPPCPEQSSRSAGPIVSVVQPSNYGLHAPLVGGLGIGGVAPLANPGSVVTVQQPLSGYYRAAEPGPPAHLPAARTIPFAPFGVEQQQQQQMRASQFAAARSQQLVAMRAAANAADCDDQQYQPPARASSYQGQQQMMMRQAYRPSPQAYASMREAQKSADLAKQCAEQEQEIQQKSQEISDLKKQLDKLSSMVEKTAVEQKTVAVRSSSPAEGPKEIAEDAKKDPQSVKKKK